MKKFSTLLFIFFLFSGLSAQVEYEKVGSIYNFWDRPTDYAVYGDYAFVIHDGMIETYNILSNDKLELINTINDEDYRGSVKLIDDYLFSYYMNIDEHKYHYAVFNISDPSNPIKIKDIAEGSEPNIVTAVVNGNYAYSENLKIWDTADILNPSLLFASQFEPFVALDGAQGAKPLRIQDGYLIIARLFYNDFTGRSSWSYNKIDVSDPLNPVDLGTISGVSAGVTKNQMINDSLHYTFPIGWSYLITIENIADPDNPVQISMIKGSHGTYPEGTLFTQIGDYIYSRVTSNYIDTNVTQVRNVGDIYIINVSDPYNPILEKVFHTKADYSFEPTKIGNKIYSISNEAKFGIIDFSDPVNPVETMTELSDNPYGWPIGKVIVQGHYAYLQSSDKYFNSNMYGYPLPSKIHAIRIVDISDPANMKEVSVIDSAVIYGVDGDYLYCRSGISWEYGFSIYNISDPENPYKESSFSRQKAIIDFKVNNGFAYLILNGIGDIYVIDVRDASNPKLVNIFGNGYNGLCFDGNFLYTGGYVNKWDISDPSNPVNLGASSTHISGPASVIEYMDNKIFYFRNAAMGINDISNFPNIVVLGTYQPTGEPPGFRGSHALNGIYAYLSSYYGVRVVDFNNPNNPVLAAMIEVPGFINNDVAFDNNYIYTANKHSFDIYKLKLPAPPERFSLLSISGTVDTTAVNLIWQSTTDPNVPIVYFDVYLATKSDFSDKYKIAGGLTDTTFHVSDLMIGQTYYWKVHAKDINTSGTWSSNSLSFSVSSPDVTVKFENNIGGETKGGVTVLNENIIYVPSSSKVARLNGDGSVEYTLNVNGVIKSSSTITSDHTVYIASTDNNLYSFNSNGVTNPNWPVALGAEATASVAVGPGGNLYIGTSNGIYQAISRGGDILWSYNVGAAVYSSSVISSEATLYVINKNGRMFAFDLNAVNPSDVQYKWKLELGGGVSSSPALDNGGNVYITTELGKLIKVKDAGSSGVIQWVFNSEGECESSPVIDGALNIYFSGKGGKVFSVNGNSGNLNWEAETHYSHSNPDKILKASPSLSADGSKIYTGDTFGTIYGISTTTGKIIWAKKESGVIEGPILATNNEIYLCLEGRALALNEPGFGALKNIKERPADTSPVWATFQGNPQRTGYNGESSHQQYANILALRENDDNGIPLLIDSIKSITGVITASNHFGAKGPAFIQDDEAGVSIYGKNFIDLISLGDSISVSGRLGIFGGLTQLKWDSVSSAVTVHRNLGDPLPGITAIENILNQSWNWLEKEEGKLVKIENVTFEVTGVFEADNNYSFTDGNNSLNVRIDNDVNLVSENIPAGVVDLVGCVGQYKAQAPYNSGYQLLLRRLTDIIIKTSVEVPEEIPTDYSLNQNYPNPFNPSTVIKYGIPKSGMVVLKVCDILGNEVGVLVNESQNAGIHSVSFDASKLGSGVYIYTITSGEFSRAKKMLLLK